MPTSITGPGTGPAAVNELFAALQTDRLVAIYIGEDTKPIHVQQSLLCASADYFKNLLTNDTFDEARTGVVKFPEDDVEGWKILLCWIVKRELSTYFEADIAPAMCKAWGLGEKARGGSSPLAYYNIPTFQDEVMWQLCRHLQRGPQADADTHYVELFGATLPETTPRQCVAEDFVKSLVFQGIFEWQDVPSISNDASFAPSIVSALKSLKCDNIDSLRVDDTDESVRLVWMRYMVGVGPRFAEYPWYRAYEGAPWCRSDDD